MQKILLKDKHPELADQLVDQSLKYTLASSSKKSVWWRCEKGHEWEALVCNRANKGYGCPFCSGRLAIPGETDLQTLYPDIAKELVDQSLATQLKPTSHKQVEWRCEKGHTYTAPVSRRVDKGSGCPYCSGRKAWPGESDLATLYPELAAELVDQSLATILRPGSNKEVEWKCEHGHTWRATPNTRVHMHTGCPYCAGKKRDVGKNDLATTHPDLVKQMSEKDRHLATEVGSNSWKVVEWHCPEGHVWSVAIINRARNGQGCPYCSGNRIMPGFNDLATKRPELAKELLDPELGKTLAEYSHTVVKWKCECGHVWESSVVARTYGGRTCPECSEFGRSKKEQELFDIVCQLVGEDNVKHNDKSLLNGLELDIVVPSKKIAIEFNGCYWHSDALRDNAKTRHIDKFEKCQKIGYQLLQIWEDVWDEKRDICIRLIANKLGVIDNVGNILNDDTLSVHHMARKCTCMEIGGSIAREFLIENHIQGATNATRHFGLYDSNELCAVLSLRVGTASVRTGRANDVWEIVRYATKGIVNGGFTKLLSFAERTILGDKLPLTKWVTFSDNCISNGSLYESSGFEAVKNIAPDYKYIGTGCKNKRTSKEQFQKKRFRDDPKLLFDENMTETELAKLNGLHKIWDAGKIRWEKKI